MNRQSIRIFFFTIGISLFFVCCNKEGDGPIIDKEAPNITIQSPEENARFEAGSLMQVMVDIEENLELHEYTILLKAVNTDVVLIVDAGHSHSKMLRIEKEVQLPSVQNQQYQLMVEATDHDANTQTAVVNFYTE